MAGKRIETMDLRQLIILKKQGLSNRKIAPLLQISRNTVNSYTKVFESLNHNYDYLLALDDLSLAELCAPESEVSADRYEALANQFEYFSSELKKPGCTLLTLWHEYRQKEPDGYGYTQFIHHYNLFKSEAIKITPVKPGAAESTKIIQYLAVGWVSKRETQEDNPV